MPSAHLPPTAFVLFLQNHDQIGNRAFGERLTTLTRLRPHSKRRSPCRSFVRKFRCCSWVKRTRAETPFLFFADHGPELADAVRDGRRTSSRSSPPSLILPIARGSLTRTRLTHLPLRCRVRSGTRRGARSLVSTPVETAGVSDRAAACRSARIISRSGRPKGGAGSMAAWRRRSLSVGDKSRCSARGNRHC